MRDIYLRSNLGSYNERLVHSRLLLMDYPIVTPSNGVLVLMDLTNLIIYSKIQKKRQSTNQCNGVIKVYKVMANPIIYIIYILNIYNVMNFVSALKSTHVNENMCLHQCAHTNHFINILKFLKNMLSGESM